LPVNWLCLILLLMVRRPQNPSVPPKLTPQQAILLLKRQLERLETEVINLPHNHPDVTAWEQRTTVLLDETFGQPNGQQHPNTHEFVYAKSGLPTRMLGYRERPNPQEAQKRYHLRQEKRAALLRTYIEQLEDEVALSASGQPDAQETTRPTGDTVFIGHGHSPLWRELKDFLQDRLHLKWDEFNRESTPGLSTKERLKTMVAQSGFALLVLTSDDEHPDGSFHPRENVIHEAGLFQGKLGFERAIILREQDCAEFSNIHGLTQILFPKGNIAAVFEDIRRVLEREGMLRR
jgi:predicted nucleotide-binding protein